MISEEDEALVLPLGTLLNDSAITAASLLVVFLKSTEEGILLKIEKKVTEEDIMGLIKKELPYNSVEIKKRGSKGLKW